MTLLWRLLRLAIIAMVCVRVCVSMHTHKGGTSQHKQRKAEEMSSLYVGRVESEKLCALLKCCSPLGSCCQSVEGNDVLFPGCVCPQPCPQQRAPECSILRRTDGKEGLLHLEKCRLRRSTGQARRGPTLGTSGRCTEEELGQFSYHLLKWFLLDNRMVDGYVPGALPLRCLSDSQRTQLAQQWFGILDLNRDGKLTYRELRKLRYEWMPIERCASKFFRSCDQNRNKEVTLREWKACTVRRTEAWFHKLMSMKMGSPQMCPAVKET